MEFPSGQIYGADADLANEIYLYPVGVSSYFFMLSALENVDGDLFL